MGFPRNESGDGTIFRFLRTWVMVHPPIMGARPTVLSCISEEKLRRRLHALAWGEKQTLVGFLRHLDEFDQRRAYAPLGYPSLFQYCVREMAFSEDEAYLRIQAARLSRKYPEVLVMLGRGEMHLSGLAKLAPHLTPMNARKLLEDARGRSKREIERIIAGLGTVSPRKDDIRFLPPAPSGPKLQEEGPQAPLALGSDGDFGAQGVASSPAPSAGDGPSGVAYSVQLPMEPAERLARISFTASERLIRKIQRVRILLSHKHPAGRLEQLCEDAFDALLARRDPERRVAVSPSRAADIPSAKKRSRRISRRLKDLVWHRDGGRCVFVGSAGNRCPATEWLEFDHVRPFALGGSSEDPSNIRLLCRTHNTHAARQIFGPGPWSRKAEL